MAKSMREMKIERAAKAAVGNDTQRVTSSDIIRNSYVEPKRTEEEKKNDEWRHLEPAINITASAFDSAFSAKLITSTELESMISNVFRPMSDQYYGCSIQFVNNNQMDIVVYFNEKKVPSSGSKVDIIERKNSKRHMNSNELAYAYSVRGGMKNADQTYVITQKGADLLIPFIDINKFHKGDIKDLNINWGDRNLKFESVNQDISNVYSYNQQFIVVGIHLDVNRLLKKIYGSKDADGNNLHYAVTKGTPIIENFAGVAFTGNRYMIQISQMNVDTINKIYNMIGNNGNGNFLNINTK